MERPVSKQRSPVKELLANKRVTINICIVSLIALCYSYLFILPKIKENFQLSPKLAKLKMDIARINQEWANLAAFKQKIARFEGKINSYEKKLPSEKEIPALLNYLSDTAKKLDVRLVEIKPSEIVQGQAQPYYTIPISLVAECGYHQLGRFLNELERADRFMKIGYLKIEPAPAGTNLLKAELAVVTYVMSKK